jgi:hypothetical protein
VMGTKARLATRYSKATPTMLSCKYPKPFQGSCHGDVEKLWREFFSDPSQWWDHRSEKVTRSIFLVILLLMQEVCEWLIVLGSGSLVGCED